MPAARIKAEVLSTGLGMGRKSGGKEDLRPAPPAFSTASCAPGADGDAASVYTSASAGAAGVAGGGGAGVGVRNSTGQAGPAVAAAAAAAAAGLVPPSLQAAARQEGGGMAALQRASSSNRHMGAPAATTISTHGATQGNHLHSLEPRKYGVSASAPLDPRLVAAGAAPAFPALSPGFPYLPSSSSSSATAARSSSPAPAAAPAPGATSSPHPSAPAAAISAPPRASAPAAATAASPRASGFPRRIDVVGVERLGLHELDAKVLGLKSPNIPKGKDSTEDEVFDEEVSLIKSVGK
ncbi:unnamed protein product [Closterium sp. Naga37s-1]|nr:unnamed protein product [Closterium sp. Naga37s-1]